MLNKRIIFICPFDLSVNTGTPLRSKITIRTLEGISKEITTISHNNKFSGYNIEPKNRFGKLRFFWWWLYVVVKLIRTKPDVIHFVSSFSIAPVIIYKFLNRGVKLIAELHGLKLYEVGKKNSFIVSFFLALDKLTLKFSDYIITSSKSLRKLLIKGFHISENKIFSIWDPIELEDFSLSQNNRLFTVGYAGNDYSWQGLDLLLEAAEQTTRVIEDIKFMFIGLSPHKYKRFSSERIEFLGRVDREKIVPYLNSCDIFVSPRRGMKVTSTQFPQKLAQYLAVGRPVVATDVSDQRAVVEDAECGIVIRPDDADELKKAIISLKNTDKDLLNDMGLKARNFAEKNFSLKNFEEKLREIYYFL